MTAPAATIDRGHPAAVAAPLERGGAMKFTYASGSRPLEGFTIKRGIGRGGFGEVYFATSDAGKEVALKHIERNLEVELRGVSQCLNLKHPNLIDLYDIRYDDQGDAWVVMEYVSGASLKDTLDRNPNGLPLDQVNFWFRGMVQGVAYLHDHGIVHRDLKPGNIFEDSGFVKIGDYGLSKFISTSRRSGQTESVGTFHYMAPEIGKGVYGKEIDIYALGIVLYEMITGRVPFDGESSQEIIMKHLTADPDLAGVPQPYRAVIERALQKDPAKRFHKAADMLAALAPAPSPAAGMKPGPASRAATALAGTKPGPGVPNRTVQPLYIADDSDGIELGPLQIHPEKAIVVATPVNHPGHRLASPAAQAGRAAAGRPAGTRFGSGSGGGQGAAHLAHWWTHGPLNTLLKITLLVAAAAVAIAHGGWWLLPLAVIVGTAYLVFRSVKWLVDILSSKPPPPATAAACATHPPDSPTRHALSWEEQGRKLLREKTLGDRLGELTGSMLVAALVAAVLAAVMTAIAPDRFDDSANPLAGPAWLWLMTTLGTWLVLATGAWCERSTGEQIRRRFAMLVVGLVFAALAYATSQHLMVRFGDVQTLQQVTSSGLTRDFYNSAGDPRLPAFLAYFGAVFLTVGWWKQCDPLRSSRLKLGPILVAIVAAWVWQLVWPFPQPWGFMLVAAMAICTQLSAPWLSPAERTAAFARQA